MNSFGFICVKWTSNEWKGLPRPQLDAVRRPATQCHDGECEFSSTHSEREVVSIVYTKVDLAKSVSSVHGVDEQVKRCWCGRALRATLLHELIVSLPA